MTERAPTATLPVWQAKGESTNATNTTQTSNTQQTRTNNAGNGDEDSLAPRGMPGQTTDRRANEGGPTTGGGTDGGLAQEPTGAPPTRTAGSPALESQASNPGDRPSRSAPGAASTSSEPQNARSTQSHLSEDRSIPGHPTGAQCAPEQHNAERPNGQPTS